MGCKCNVLEIVLGIVILVFAFLQGVSGLYMWIIAIAGVLLLIHALMCKNCNACSTGMPGKMPTKSSKKKKRR